MRSSAQRVFRGVPTVDGAVFAKDTACLHGLPTVHTVFRRALKSQRLDLIRALFVGKLAPGDVVALAPWFANGFIVPAPFLPPWLRRTRGLAGSLAFSLFASRIGMADVDAADLALG